MKKSDLFKKFEIDKLEHSTIVGGFLTSVGSDTNNTGGHDVLKNTYDSEGNSLGMDSIVTGPGDTDKPNVGIVKG